MATTTAECLVLTDGSLHLNINTVGKPNAQIRPARFLTQLILNGRAHSNNCTEKKHLYANGQCSVLIFLLTLSECTFKEKIEAVY